MRILMLDNEFPPLGGGTGIVNQHIMEEMLVHPHIHIDLVTSSRTASSYEVVPFASRSTLYKVPVDNQNIHHSSNSELLRYAWRGWRKARQLHRQSPYDVCLAWAGVPAGVMAWALYREFRLPYYVSLQGPDVPGFEARYNYLYPILKPILRVVWSNAHVVSAISRDHRELARQTLPNLDIPIVYNGVDTNTFKPNGAPSSSLNIICVGRLIERKGQQHLLRAFAQIKRARPQQAIRLIFVGTGDSESEYRTLANELGIAADTQFCGFVDRETIPTLYHQSHMFVLPSQNEGMSIALLEALASGLPVIVTDSVGGTEELVTPYYNGLVVPWADVESLTKALLYMVDHPDERHVMAQHARQVALQYSWSSVAGQHLALLESMIAPKRIVTTRE